MLLSSMVMDGVCLLKVVNGYRILIDNKFTKNVSSILHLSISVSHTYL